MTEFQRSQEELEALIPLCEALLNGSPAACVSSFGPAKARMVRLEASTMRLKRKALERDPTKRTFGPKMKARVLEFVDKFEEMHSVWLEEIEPVYLDAWAAFQRAEAARAAAETAEAAVEAAKLVERGRIETAAEEAKRQAATRDAATSAAAAQDELAAAVRRHENAERARRQAVLASVAAISLCGDVLLDTRGAVSRLKVSGVEKRDLLRRLVGILSSVMDEPDNQQHRTLRLGNELFQRNIAGFGGYEGILLAAGFRLYKGEDIRDRLELLLTGESLLALQRLVLTDELFWVSWEPDPEADFGKWQVWMSRFRDVKSELEALIEEGKHDCRGPTTR